MDEKALDGRRLNLNLGETDNSINPKKLKGNNDLKALKVIAEKWVVRRCYPTFERALIALVRGDIHE